MSRKLSLSLCCLLLMCAAASVLAEAPAPADAKTQVAGAQSLALPQAPTAMCGTCGDGWCVAMCGETAENCPIDCGKTKPVIELMFSDCAAVDQPEKKAEPKQE